MARNGLHLKASGDRSLVEVVRRALAPTGLAVSEDGPWLVVMSADDAGTGRPGLTGRLSARELARWADGWLACWRVWGGGKG